MKVIIAWNIKVLIHCQATAKFNGQSAKDSQKFGIKIRKLCWLRFIQEFLNLVKIYNGVYNFSWLQNHLNNSYTLMKTQMHYSQKINDSKIIINDDDDDDDDDDDSS